MSERFFLTGATGFIGARLARRLVESGAFVKCLARANSKRGSLDELGVEVIEGDLFDLNALAQGARRVDFVIHLAGLTRENQRGDFQRVNCVGVENLLETCSDAAGSASALPVVVITSSLAAAGVAPRARSSTEEKYGGRRLRRETDVSRPVSPYGRSKREAEEISLRYSSRLPITVVRPPYVYGPGDLASLPLFCMAAKRGNFVMPGFGDPFYSFIYVDDLVDGIIAAARCGRRIRPDSLTLANDAQEPACSGEGFYFLSEPRPIRFSTFGRQIGVACGRKKTRVFRIPPAGVIGAGIWGECAKNYFHRSVSFDWNKMLEAMHGPWICSSQKARDEFGFQTLVSTEDGVNRAVAWYRENGYL